MSKHNAGQSSKLRGSLAQKRKSSPKGEEKQHGRAYELLSHTIPSMVAHSSQIERAIVALRNNETRVTSEVKGANGKVVMDTSVSYPPDLLKAMRSLFPASRVYGFQMHFVMTQTSDSGGGLLGSIALNPSATSWSEWSTLSALFDEVKGVSTAIEFLSTYAVGTTPPVPMIMAFDEVQTASSAPSSYTSILRLAESDSWVMSLGKFGSGKHTQTRKLTSREWCSTGFPVSVEPMGGLAGRWSFGQNSIFPVSTSIATVNLYCNAIFRNRA